MAQRISRRGFLRAGALAAAGFSILPRGRSAWSYAANDSLDVALIGAGGRGRWFVNTVPGLGENVVALCDVDERKAGEAYKKIPDARRYRDFRKLLDDLGEKLDAVIIATPDHTHAAATAAAMRAGKHVYCEKPLTHDPLEARRMRELAARCEVATQMGNQGTASREFRRAVEIIQAGILGEVREVHVWNTGGGPGKRSAPEGAPAVPEELEWDLWLGPVEARPYHPDWLRWHGWRDFGTGQLGNWGCHTANLAFKSLRIDSLWRAEPAGEDAPVIRLEAEVPERTTETFPRQEVVRYRIPARGDLPALDLHWYNGAGRAPGPRESFEKILGRRLDWGDAGERKWRDHAGCLIVGSEGTIHATGHNATFTLLPEEKFRDLEGPDPSLARSPGHEREWFRAARGGAPAMSSFEYAGPLTEFVLLGNVATLVERPIEFDPVSFRIRGNEAAERALGRDYREGWSL